MGAVGRCIVVCGGLWLCAASPLSAAEPLAPATQARVDAAVAQYQAGRLVLARRAFERLAQQRVPAAEYNLAVMHLRGELPQASAVRARLLLERAAASGFVTAQLMLGRADEAGGELGPRNLPQAMQWYERAAQNGNALAQLELGTAFYLGRGKPADAAQAVLWFREAAKAGDVGAMYLLASMYQKGEGVGQDLRRARHWYALAAAQGDPAAAGQLRQIDAQAARADQPD